jgi:tripartite-type tricarboxylate transporter receptor subunit TctC
MTLAHAGVGTGQHLTAVAVMKYAGVQMLEVPYKGSSAVYPDLLSGRVDLFVDSTAAALPFVRSGQLKGFGIMSAARSASAPNLPTMTEAGIANFEVDSWIGIFAPSATPREAIARLQGEIAASMPDIRAQFERAGGEALSIPPEQLKAFVQADYDKWTAIIKSANITLDK